MKITLRLKLQTETVPNSLSHEIFMHLGLLTHQITYNNIVISMTFCLCVFFMNTLHRHIDHQNALKFRIKLFQESHLKWSKRCFNAPGHFPQWCAFWESISFPLFCDFSALQPVSAMRTACSKPSPWAQRWARGNSALRQVWAAQRGDWACW